MYTFVCLCIWSYIPIYDNVPNPKVGREGVGTDVVLEATTQGELCNSEKPLHLSSFL